jgi:hypothetical protein
MFLPVFHEELMAELFAACYTRYGTARECFADSYDEHYQVLLAADLQAFMDAVCPVTGAYDLRSVPLAWVPEDYPDAYAYDGTDLLADMQSSQSGEDTCTRVLAEYRAWKKPPATVAATAEVRRA